MHIRYFLFHQKRETKKSRERKEVLPKDGTETKKDGIPPLPSLLQANIVVTHKLSEVYKKNVNRQNAVASFFSDRAL